MPGACALLRFDHQLEVCRSWAKRPHAAAPCPPRLRSFGLRAAFCDFLAAGIGSWARSVVAAVVDAVTAVVAALSGAVLSGVVCGELAPVVAALRGAGRGELTGGAETCR